jgi:hypothetical protein
MSKDGNLFKGPLSLQAFEELVADTFPGVTITKRSVNDEGFDGKTFDLHLYYCECDVADKYGSKQEHVGTYRVIDSVCWIFEYAFEHPGLAHLAH